jgi:hypothetical protein
MAGVRSREISSYTNQLNLPVITFLSGSRKRDHDHAQGRHRDVDSPRFRDGETTEES